MATKHKTHEIAPASANSMMPLLDVVMQLILFLMLAGTWIRPNQIELDLPDSSSSVKAPERDVMTVTYRLENGKPAITLDAVSILSLEALASAMKSAHPEAEKPAVAVRIDRTVPYQEVIGVMDTLRGAGFPKFSLLTLDSGKKG